MIENLFSRLKKVLNGGEAIFILLMLGLVCCQNDDVNSKTKVNRRLCAHSVYPCYYFYCDEESTLNANSMMFKCAKGLIYDDKIQHCVWAMPWQTCTLTNKYDLYAAASKSNKTWPNYFNLIEAKPSLVFNGNKKLGEKVTNSILDSLALSLKLKEPQPHLESINKIVPVENRFDLVVNSQPSFQSKKNTGKLKRPSAVGLPLKIRSSGDGSIKNMIQVSENVEYYDSDFNVTVDNEENQLEFDEQSTVDQYAYIVVPIKIAKNRKLPDLNIVNMESTRKKNKKVSKDSKNYEDVFKYKKICYVTNWSQYRPKPAQFTPENVDPFLCTHLIYAFAYIDNLTLTIRTIEENDEEMYRRINDLKYKNPKLKTMLGVGGWNMKSREFSKMVRNVFTRENFINHAIRFVRYYNFDGIDLDWEFPGERGGSEEDKPNFTLLLKEFRQAINDEAYAENRTPLILSIAVAAAKDRIDKGYEIKKITSELDFINIMTFDYRGSWDATTGLNAPLYGHENVTQEEVEMNQDWSISYWIKNGCPPHKIVLGLPAYGRSFFLKDKSNHGLGSPSQDKNATYGNFTKTSGFLSYYEICQMKKEKNWTNVWLPQSKSNYMYRGHDWISYDDIKSFHLRTAYVVAKKLGGIFIWSIDMDDFSGKFCNLGSYPLIKNSMSLLMDYMPEWYSSNVNQPKRKQKQQAQQEAPSSSKIFYILKDDQLNLDDVAVLTNQKLVGQPNHYQSLSQSSLFAQHLQSQQQQQQHVSAQDFDLVKQNRIRNDLLNLLTQQPNKFVSFNLPDTFNCSSKQKGFHRDPFDCTKYYFCSDAATGASSSPVSTTILFGQSRIESNIIQTKAYTCPKNTVFNMNGCYCEKETNSNINCHYLSDTYCDFGLFRSVEKKFT